MSWVNQEDSVELCVCTPHRGNVSFNWATNFASLRLPDHIISSKSTAAIDLAREQTIKNALENSPEWLLMLDSDVIPPRDVYERLLDHDLDIVSASYVVDKMPPHLSAWAYESEEGLSAIDEWEDNSLLNVDAVGMGCCLISRRVFEDIERPWFRWTEGFETHPWDLSDEIDQKGIGEDFFFCYKALQEGYNIYYDTSIRCAHEKPGVLTHEGFKPETHYREEREE